MKGDDESKGGGGRNEKMTRTKYLLFETVILRIKRYIFFGGGGEREGREIRKERAL